MPFLAEQLYNFPELPAKLQAVFEKNPWFAGMQLSLFFCSIVLNFFLVGMLLAGSWGIFRRRLPEAPWSVGKGLQLVGAYAFVFFGVFVFMSLLYQQTGGMLKKHGWTQLHITAAGMALTHVMALILVWRFATAIRLENATSPGLISYWNSGSWRRAGWGFVLLLLLIAPVNLTLAMTGVVFRKLGLPFDEQPLVVDLQSVEGTWFLAMISFSAVVVAPLIEEMLFRGVLYPTLRKRFGWKPALFLNSFFFAFLHFHLPTFLPLFVLALILTSAFELTGSLSACVIAHSLFNGLSISVIWLMRGTQ